MNQATVSNMKRWLLAAGAVLAGGALVAAMIGALVSARSSTGDDDSMAVESRTVDRVSISR